MKKSFYVDIDIQALDRKSLVRKLTNAKSEMFHLVARGASFERVKEQKEKIKELEQLCQKSLKQ